jgi:cellulose biosynthesis protein BcsQ
MRVLSIVNNKGGVGKTTVSTWLSQGLAIIGKRVLVIDNDKQHNATAALSGGESKAYPKTIRDIYQLQDFSKINEVLTDTVQSSSIENLFYIPSTAMLSHLDIIDTEVWKNVFELSSMKDFFDVVIFDNPPGSDLLQASTLLSCDTVVIPTELKTRATQGLFELYSWLTETMNFTADRIKIIPNGYKKWSKYEGFLGVIKAEFSSSLTTAIPYDEVFDELDATNKVIFFSRLRAKAAPYVIKVLTEIFPDLPDTNTLEVSLHKKRSAYQSQQARLRFDRERIMQHVKN